VGARDGVVYACSGDPEDGCDVADAPACGGYVGDELILLGLARGGGTLRSAESASSALKLGLFLAGNPPCHTWRILDVGRPHIFCRSSLHGSYRSLDSNQPH
jgi:hypothetical protein